MSRGGHVFALSVHPLQAAMGEAAAISVRWQRDSQGVELEYDIRSRDPVLLQPRVAAAAGRHDNLWKHTCCEWFVAATAIGGAYLEFNFSPTGDWAAYAFDSPRTGRRDFLWTAERAMPQIRHVAETLADGPWAHWCRVNVQLEIPLDAAVAFVNPAVVLETTAGVSYWAARHPHAHPDFHHPAGFVGPFEVS